MTSHAPQLERWEAFRLSWLNEQQSELLHEQAKEWRERASKRGTRWQDHVKFALRAERDSRTRIERARAWKQYGKTLP